MKTFLQKLSLILFVATLFLVPAIAAAEEDREETDAEKLSKPIFTKLQVPLPFVNTGGTYKGSPCEVEEIHIINNKPTKVQVPAVCSLTNYLQGLYRLLIGVGAIFAVVMIIIAGYQWIFSGGSADKTGAAKKRILSAVIGLILALLSYVILNTITPRLVALRFPDVTPVQPIYSNLGNNLCNSTEVEQLISGKFGVVETTPAGTRLLAELAPGGEVRTDQPLILFSEANTETLCGKDYKIGELTGEDAFCGGVACVSDSGDLTQDACIGGKCLPVFLAGKISWPLFGNRYVDNIKVTAVCEDGGIKDGEGILDKSFARLRAYQFPREKLVSDYDDPKSYEAIDGGVTLREYEKLKAKCGSSDGFYGFVLNIEVNDDSFGVTFDDHYAVGKSGCVLNNVEPSITLKNTEGDSLEDKFKFENTKLRSQKKSDLFSLNDFELGIECSINITDDQFPAFD
jgi:type IV secretory pathway VirB2 component (pilin)